jgi:glycosyltransferase involved in cell wall biosynthesis
VRIISVYYTHKRGGLCKRLYRCFEALATRGHDVHYFTLDQPPETFPAQVKVCIIPFPTKSRRGLLFWGLFSIWCPLYVLISGYSRKPDCLIAFGSYYSTALLPLHFFTRASLCLFLRSLSFDIDEILGKPGWLRGAIRTFERIGLERATKIVLLTAAMEARVKEKFPTLDEKKFRILPNDLPQCPKTFIRKKAPDDKFTLLTSGVLDARKNISLLFQALSTLKHKKILLLIAGEGPLLHALKRNVHELNLEETVTFLGWQESLWLHLERADLVVHPSLHEGMSNSILEALSAGVPVLAADTPEAREIFQDDLLLFSPHDPTQLARRIEDLSSSPSLYDRMEQSCAKAAKPLHFDWDQRIVDVIGEIGRPGAPSTR